MTVCKGRGGCDTRQCARGGEGVIQDSVQGEGRV